MSDPQAAGQQTQPAGQQTQPAETPQKDAGKKNTRALLQAYYGDAVTQETPVQNRRVAAYDLDSADFDPERYLSRVLHEKPLADLIARDNELILDMREIDGTMKTLVYDNYSRFVAATSTISSIHATADSMEAEMQLLQNNVEAISRTAKQINDVLADKRSRIHQLISVHAPLIKLQHIIELPTRMRQCIRQKAFLQAKRCFSRNAGLLAANQHLTIFRNVEKECQQLLESIAPQLAELDEAGSAEPAPLVHSDSSTLL